MPDSMYHNNISAIVEDKKGDRLQREGLKVVTNYAYCIKSYCYLTLS